MKKVLVVYWSGTGNTEAMANALVEGIEEVIIKEVGDASVAEVEACEALALGCPSMGDEVLEEDMMEPFVESIKDVMKDKPLALFGSYGWGDGQWMRDWEERMKGYGVKLVADPVIVMGEPDDDAKAELKELGATLQ